MGIVVSLLMITVGSIMRFAVTTEAESFDVGTAGMVLIVVGVLGAVLSIAFWASWGGFPRRSVAVRQSGTVVDTTVHEREVL